MYHLTENGRKNIERYILEMNAQRKEVLDAGLDTADEVTKEWTVESVFDDFMSFPIDEDGDIYDSFAVTDNDYDSPVFGLTMNEDFVIDAFKAVNIKWDIDEAGGIELPTEVEIPYDVIKNVKDEDELEETVSDWLSDEYGWCHNGFELKNIQMQERLTEALADFWMDGFITHSFEEAKNNNRRKNIVLLEDGIYITFKANTENEKNVFGELACWVEDEFVEDESVYQTSVNAVIDLFTYSDEGLNRHILDDDLIESFTRYDNGAKLVPYKQPDE